MTSHNLPLTHPLTLLYIHSLTHSLAHLPTHYAYSLAPCSPTLAPNNSVLHYKGSKHGNQTGCRIATHRLPALASCIRFYLKSIVIRGLRNSRQIIKLTNLSAFQQSNIEIPKAGQPPIQIGVVPNILLIYPSIGLAPQHKPYSQIMEVLGNETLHTSHSQYLDDTLPRLETSIQ